MWLKWMSIPAGGCACSGEGIAVCADQVPTHKPAQMLDLVRHFVAGELFSMTIKPASLSTLSIDGIHNKSSSRDIYGPAEVAR